MKRFLQRIQYHVAFWGFFTLFHLSGAIIYKEAMVWKEFWMPWLATNLILMGLVYSNFYLILPLAMKKKTVCALFRAIAVACFHF